MAKQYSIYSINIDMYKGKTNEVIIDEIIKGINKDIIEDNTNSQKEIFEEQTVKEILPESNIKYKIYYKSHKYKPDWINAIEEIVEPDQDICKAENYKASFLLFVYYDKYIYAICGGNGSMSILKYVDSMFGIDILSKIVEKDSMIIKSIKSTGITGSVLAASQLFRHEQSIYDEDRYGKFFRELEVDLDDNIISGTLGINLKSKSKVSCTSGSSFNLHTSLNIKQLILLIDKLMEIQSSTEVKFQLMDITLVNNKSNNGKNLSEELTNELISKIYMFITDGDDFDCSIIHKNFEEYNNADSYFLKHNRNQKKYDYKIDLIDVKGFIKDIYNAMEPSPSVDQKKGIIRSLKIISTKDGGNVTNGDLLSHIMCELKYNNKIYFLIHKQWYYMNSDLITDLNNTLKYMLSKANKGSLQLDIWNHELMQEDDYNVSFTGRDNYIVIHKILYQNIEMADILNYDDEEVRFIHVKYGMDSSMRDLTNQIYNAARILQLAKKSNNYKFAETIYDQLENINKKKDKYSEYKQDISEFVKDMTKEDFVKLFEKREMCICLAVSDIGNGRDLNDISKFDSNIAKLSLIDIIRSMNNIGFKFYIEWI